jgi:hypothetical protein
MPIIINGKTINEISGPTIFTLLKPKKDMFDKFKVKKFHLPIVMLLGGVHFSKNNICKDCETNKNCQQMYTNSFLELLDDYSKKKGRIEFNIEDFYEEKILNQKKNDEEYYNELSRKEKFSLLDELNFNVLPCMFERTSSNFEKHCKAKSENMNFYFIDPRTKSISFEQNLFFLVRILSSFIDCNNNEELELKIKEIITFMNVKLLEEQIYIIYYILKEKSFDALYHNKKIKKTFFYKEFKKQTVSPFNLFPFWIKNINKYLELIFKELVNDEIRKRAIHLIIVFSRILILSSEIETTLNSKVLKEKNDKLRKYKEDLLINILNYKYKFNIKNLFVNVTNVFVDVPYILKLLNNENPIDCILSIGYLGSLHSYYLEKFLINILGFYERIVYINYDKFTEIKKQKPTDVSRCLTFSSEVINVDNIIDEYKIKDGRRKKKSKSKRKKKSKFSKRKLFLYLKC